MKRKMRQNITEHTHSQSVKTQMVCEIKDANKVIFNNKQTMQKKHIAIPVT